MIIDRAVKKYGFIGTLKRLPRFIMDDLGIREHLLRKRYASSVIYKNPTDEELETIEHELSSLGISLQDYYISAVEFQTFCAQFPFPENYHGGKHSGVWDEKMAEHYNAYQLLSLRELEPNDIYVDVAACNSPWARILREQGISEAYAIDLNVPETYRSLNYYLQCDATDTPFAADSVVAVSLQCAFEMFVGDDDEKLIDELARILKPGGRALINPLYMHTHYCSYASFEYFNKGYSYDEAVEYLRPDIRGIPSSRKYNAEKLYQRILRRIESNGLRCQILVLRDKAAISHEIYCHFLLLIHKDAPD